jgi:nucleolar protein 56
MIGARLFSLAGSLYKLSKYPASTIQTLGAEKAMFRHLKTGDRPPKYGILVLHPLVAKSKRDDRGRVARTLAAKISLAAKIDYFGGDEHKGLEMRAELEKQFGAY